jgi:gamma-glutamylputrescine oxidase
MLSYWEYKTFFQNIDVAILGSGIVGLNAAIRLKELNKRLNVVVIERGTLPHGASTRNAGFACFGSLTELIDDLETHSESEVFSLVERRFQGLSRLRQRVGDQRLKYKQYGGYEIFKPEETPVFEKCVDKIAYFNKNIATITHLPETYRLATQAINSFGFQQIKHQIHNVAEGQIDTGAMMDRLLKLAQQKGIRIFNGLTITHLDDNGNTVGLTTSENWVLQTKKLLVCTNGFARRLMPNLAVEPARNQVLITAPIPKLSVKGCFHYDSGYVYFRNIDQRILLGGGRNLARKTEQTDQFATTDLIQTALEKLLREVILPHSPDVLIEHRWSGILGIGAQKKPIIEHTSANVAVAVRMGGMGVAIGSLVGEDGAQLILQGI